MPLDEREREELEKKINQQRRAMWKGQATNERRTKKRRARKEDREILERPQEYAEAEQTQERPKKPEESEQVPEANYRAAEDGPVEQNREPEQPSAEEEHSERQELAKKIKQQRRSVWKGKPAAKSKKKKNVPGSARSIRRDTRPSQDIESAEQPIADQSTEQEAKEKSRDYQSKAPALKLALIVIIGLIGAIAIGIAVGYLAAVRNLIDI